MQLFLTSCSNPTLPWAADKLPLLREALAARGHTLDTSGVEELARAERAGGSGVPWRWSPRERARLLAHAFADPEVDAILDISGGDLANEVLPHLDIDSVGAHPKLMVGYSDMSCILGALAWPTLLWNPLVGLATGFGELDAALAGQVIRPPINKQDVATLRWFGGNIRCFLKLAGTDFWPDMSGGALLIEGQGPGLKAVAALLAHHELLGTFGRVEAVVVGQFTMIDNFHERPELLALVHEYAGMLPVVEAATIGHSETSGAVTLG